MLCRSLHPVPEIAILQSISSQQPDARRASVSCTILIGWKACSDSQDFEFQILQTKLSQQGPMGCFCIALFERFICLTMNYNMC